MKKYKSFGTLAWITGITSVVLIVAWVVIFIVNGQVAAATSGSVSMFATWYQTLLFVLGIIGFAGTGVLIFFFVKQLLALKKGRVEKLRVKTYGLKRNAWGIVSGVSLLVALVFLIGTPIANNYSSTINGLLNCQEYITTGGGSVYYKSDYLNSSQGFDDAKMRKASIDVATEVAADGSVLLWNKEMQDGSKALPLAENSKVSLFGIGTVGYRITGGGSGEIKASMVKNFKDALETPRSEGGAGFSVNPSLYSAYTNLKNGGAYGPTSVLGSSGRHTPAVFAGDNRYREFFIREATWNTVNSSVPGGVVPTLTTYGDAAIMTITRDGCEDGDTWFYSDECYDGNYLDLAFNEADILTNLQTLKAQGKIKKIIVILNTAQVFQMKHLSTFDVDACISGGPGGIAGFLGLGKVLSGVTNPNGALVDTYTYDVDSAPSTNNFGHFQFTSKGAIPANSISGGYALVYNDRYVVYQEGIYVGYRYYETRYEDIILGQGNASSAAGAKCDTTWKYQKEVAFPFGYGLSYTTFDFSNLQVEHLPGNFGGTYRVKVTVKNTGPVAGKTPVQVYLQKPYTQYDKNNKVEKSSIELCGFTKSDILQPNESKTYTIDVKGSELKSYDSYTKKGYILESGDYYFAVGNGAHDALNNVLANKGKSKAHGMVDSTGNPTDGNASLAKAINVQINTADGVDSTIFANSEWTGETITNRLDDCDVNLYQGTTEQHITYLTRGNWTTSYPAAEGVKLHANNAKMVADLQYTHGDIDATGYQMPLFETETIDPSFFDQFDDLDESDRHLRLIMLRELAYDDPIWEDLLNQLSWTEINHLCSGGYLNMQGAVSVGLPSGKADDGTSGVRTNNPTLGTLMGFPSETVMAQTYDVELVHRLGVAFGHECLHANVQQLYAPSADMHRHPYGGRNWEYYSEDPFMSGKMLASEVKGIQSKGVITTVKHFAFNDQEINRLGLSTFFNEQTAREINLKTFEIGINEGGILGLMQSFPRLGTKYSGSNVGLMQNILRKEWTFRGLVETDSCFGQSYQEVPGARAEAVVAGTTFWMDGSPSMIFNNYRNNARVVCAAREAAHGILYACAHSLRMNGIASNSKTVYVEAWWRGALRTGTVTSCFVTAGLALIAAAAFGLYPLLTKKKLDKDAKNDDGGNGEEKANIKVKVKKTLPVAITGCALFLGLFGTMIGLGASSIKTNQTSQQSQEKVVSKTFDAISPDVYTNGKKDVTNRYIGFLENGQELIISYYINVSDNCIANLFAVVSKSSKEQTFTDVYKTSINDVKVTSAAKINAGDDYDTVEIGTYGFNKGINKITFSYKETEPAYGHYFRAIKLQGKATFALDKDPNVAEFKGASERTRVASGAKRNIEEDCIGWDGSLGDHVEFTIGVNSSKTTQATLTAVVSGKPNTSPLFTNTFITTINGEPFSSSAIIPVTAQEWFDYEVVVLGNITLNQGNNVFDFKYYPADYHTYNFRSLIFTGCDASLTWGDSTPVPPAKETTFSACNDNVVTASGAKKQPDEDCIGWNAAMGDHVEFTFPLKSNAAVSGATLKAVVSGHPNKNPLFTDTYQTYVNGTRYIANAVMPTGEIWTSFQEIEIGRIDLVSGENNITFKYYPEDFETYNFRSLIIATNQATISWNTGDIPVPPVAEDFTFKAIDGRVDTNGEKNNVEDCVGAYYVSPTNCTLDLFFYVELAKAETVTLAYTISEIEQALPLTNVYQTFINGDKQTSTTAMPTGGAIWTGFHKVTVGSYNLNAGVNVINVKYDWHATADNACNTTNFRAITISSTQQPKLVDGKYGFRAIDATVTGDLEKKDTYGSHVANKSPYGFGYTLFTFNAASAGTATLSMNISANSHDPFTIVDYFRVWVNQDESNWKVDGGNKLDKETYTAKTRQIDAANQPLARFRTEHIGTINIKAGENTICVGWTSVGDPSYSISLQGISLSTTIVITK